MNKPCRHCPCGSPSVSPAYTPGESLTLHCNGISAVRSGLESTAPKARGVLHSHCNEPLRRSSIVPETHVRTVIGYLASGCGPEGRGFEPRRSPKLEVP